MYLRSCYMTCIYVYTCLCVYDIKLIIIHLDNKYIPQIAFSCLYLYDIHQNTCCCCRRRRGRHSLVSNNNIYILHTTYKRLLYIKTLYIYIRLCVCDIKQLSIALKNANYSSYVPGSGSRVCRRVLLL